MKINALLSLSTEITYDNIAFYEKKNNIERINKSIYSIITRKIFDTQQCKRGGGCKTEQKMQKECDGKVG